MPGVGLPRAIGAVAGIALTADAFRAGTTRGYGQTELETANEICDVFVGHQRSCANSPLLEDLKKCRRFQLLDDRIVEHFRRIKNVGVCVTKQMASYAVPFGLCLGAVTMTSNPIGWACGVALLLGGAKILATDVIGFKFGKKELY